jgi:hypothetical protein
VSVRPFGSKRDGQAPCGAELASGTVDSGGALSITDSDIVSGTRFELYALVGSEHRYAAARSTLDIFDAGSAVGTGDTNSTTALSNVAATSGAFQIGQRITGPGIPSGTRLVSGSGASWVMSAAATATATGVALKADSAYVWQARLRRRRALIGTS